MIMDVKVEIVSFLLDFDRGESNADARNTSITKNFWHWAHWQTSYNFIEGPAL